MPTLVASSEAVATDVSCSRDSLTVVLDDGRTVSVPLVWFPRLLNATEKQRKEWEFIGGGIGIMGGPHSLDQNRPQLRWSLLG
jgi:hypothetical protein